MPVAMASRTSRTVFSQFIRCYTTRTRTRDPDRTLQLRNLSWRTGEDEITQYFEKFGKIDRVFTLQNEYVGIGRGLAVVIFKNPESVNAVLEENKHVLDGKQVFIKHQDRLNQRPVDTPAEPS